MAIVPQVFLNAVTPIGVRGNNQTIQWIGTGFFVLRKVSVRGDAKPFLVTNKHVVKDHRIIVVRMKKKDNQQFGELDAPLVNSVGPIYKLHEDPNVDIAIVPLNGQYIQNNGYDFPAFDIDNNAMTSYELRDNGVDEGALIHMLGYPMGLVNVQSSLPICRLGCIARMSEAQIVEQRNMLIDVQNFPGNSGSPIILRPELVSIHGTKNLLRSVLVGIIHSYIPYEEKLFNTQTNKVVEIKSENSGIAYAHPFEFIREIIDSIQPTMPLELTMSTD